MNLRALVSSLAAAGILAIALACSRPSPATPDPQASSGSFVPPPPDRGTITTTRDDFRQRDVLRARFILNRSLDLVFATMSSDPTFVAMLFHSDTRDWMYLRCHEVLALAGDTPTAMPRFDRDGDTYRGGVTETLGAVIPAETLEAFATAPRVRFSICGDEVALNQQQRDTLWQFAQRRRRMLAEDASAPALEPPPAEQAGRPFPDRSDVLAVLAEVSNRAQACLPIGVFQMRLTYGNDGGILLAEPAADGVPESVTACVLQHARALRLPRFSRPDFVVVFPFMHQ